MGQLLRDHAAVLGDGRGDGEVGSRADRLATARNERHGKRRRWVRLGRCGGLGGTWYVYPSTAEAGEFDVSAAIKNDGWCDVRENEFHAVSADTE